MKRNDLQESVPNSIAPTGDICGACRSLRPRAGFQHVIGDDGDVVECREDVPLVDDDERKRISTVLRQAMGQELWNRLWGPELERLGGAVMRLVYEACKVSTQDGGDDLKRTEAFLDALEDPRLCREQAVQQVVKLIVDVRSDQRAATIEACLTTIAEVGLGQCEDAIRRMAKAIRKEEP